MGLQTGDTATVVKLMRVAMLVPVIMVAAWISRNHVQRRGSAEGSSQTSTARPPWLPGFAVAFVVLVALNSALVMPTGWLETGNAMSRVFLVAAMAAIGMKTQLKDVLSVGWRPVAVVFLETVFLAVLVYGILCWFFPH